MGTFETAVFFVAKTKKEIIIVVYAFAQKHIIKDVAAGAVKG